MKLKGGMELMVRVLKLLSVATIICSTILSWNQIAFAQEVIDFELEIELKNFEKYDIEYEVKGDYFEAEYQVPGSRTIYGEEAKVMIEPLLDQLQLEPRMNKKELRKQILTIFNIDEKDIDEFELEVKFSDGKKLKIER